MKLTGNNDQTILMTWSDFGGQRSRSQQAVKVAKASVLVKKLGTIYWKKKRSDI